MANIEDTEAWDPPPGVLFVRMNVGPHINEMAFAFVPEPNHPRSFRQIARIRNWESQADWGSFYECVPGQLGKTHCDSAIVRRMAEPDDVQALARLWGDPESRERFLRDVLCEPALRETSKAMIREAFGVKLRDPQ